MHICRTCQIAKPPEQYRHRGSRRICHCRDCECAYQRRWYASNIDANRERKRVAMRKDRQSDPEKFRKRGRDRHHANRDENTAKMRAYCARKRTLPAES